jgi:hypothetical protein
MQIIPETMATKTQSPPIAPSIGIAKPKPTAIAAAQTRPLPIASVLICVLLPCGSLDAKLRSSAVRRRTATGGGTRLWPDADADSSYKSLRTPPTLMS